MPSVGRNIPYVTTFPLYVLILPYVLMTIPLALIRNNPCSRFCDSKRISGSPILATGGAWLSDIYDDKYLLFAISSWSGTYFIAPAFRSLPRVILLICCNAMGR